MAFRFIFSDSDGVIYAATTSGDLLWYRHLARDGATRWANGGTARRVGTGWSSFTHVCGGGDGIVYAVEPAGALLWYRHLSRAGDVEWANGGSARQIGSGWSGFIEVFSGGDGVLYGIRPTGELFWYRHWREAGTVHWANAGIGQQIGTGWHRFARVFAGTGGVIYAVTPTGELLWFRHLSRDGHNEWAHGGAPQQIGSGWNVFTHVFAGGNGVIYGVRPTGELIWYRHLSREGFPLWANAGVGVQIGSGWDQLGVMEGYCVPLSAAPGERIAFKTSTGETHVTVTYFRLKPDASGSPGVQMTSPFVIPGRVQSPPAASPWATNCGWQTDFELDVPHDWPSGMYTARCVDADGFTHDIVFVLTPVDGRRGDVAVLANVNTWNAYNDWGGRSQYTTPNGATLTFERPNPSASLIQSTGINHLARAESWVLGWLEENRYRCDVYSDIDFHRGIPRLVDYKALVLNTHPEYWTDAMFDELDAYLAAGGCVLYLGGNGIYERVSYEPGFRRMVLRGGIETDPRDAHLFRNLVPPRPERAVLGVGYEGDNWTWDRSWYAPYAIQDASHRFFAGTGLVNGDVIGADGLNGAASGWEMDTSQELPGHAPGAPPAGIQVLAQGTNVGPDNTYGAQMTYYDTAGGGFVFSIGSLTFGGSLAVDPILQRIVRNVLDECVAR